MRIMVVANERHERVYLLRMETMITYTYECKQCGAIVEREAKAPVPKCCGRKKMVRKFHAPTILYRGDGFTGAQKEKRDD